MAKVYSIVGTTKLQREKYISDTIKLSTLDAPVMKNLLGIKDAKLLEQAEADSIRIMNISSKSSMTRYGAGDKHAALRASHNRGYANGYQHVLIILASKAAVYTRRTFFSFCPPAKTEKLLVEALPQTPSDGAFPLHPLSRRWRLLLPLGKL